VKFGIEPHILDHHSTYYIIILHHVVWCTSSHYNIMLNHHTSLQLPQEIVVPMMARKSECVSQTLCITNKFTHEKKILLHLPTCLSMRSFFSTSISLLGSCDHTLSWTCKRFEAKCKYQTTEHSKLEHLKQNANTKQRNIPSLNIWSKMQIPNNGTFQA
jgi:hypothetical protein